MTFRTGGLSERMRIDSSGFLFVGTTTQLINAQVQIGFAGASSVYGMTMRPGADTTRYFEFYNAAGGEVGSIAETNTNTAYNTTSDRRIKRTSRRRRRASLNCCKSRCATSTS